MRIACALLIGLAACKAPVEQGPVTIDVQIVVPGETPEGFAEVGATVGDALAKHGHVRTIARLGRIDFELSFERETVVAALAQTRASVEAVAPKGSAPTYVVGTAEEPPDVIVHVGGQGATDERAAWARSEVLPVIANVHGVARVSATGAEPAHWALRFDGPQLTTHGLTIVNVIAALWGHASVAAPDALADVNVEPGDVPLFDVIGFEKQAGDHEGSVDLAVWLEPGGTSAAVDNAVAQAAAVFTAKGLDVTAGRAPGHSPPKPGDVEIAIILKPNPGIHGSLDDVARELASSHLVGTMVQQPPGRDPTAYSLVLDMPEAGRAHRAELEAFVRAANGAPIVAIAGRDVVLGPLLGLDNVPLANPAGGSVPLSWTVLHESVAPTIQMYGQPALVFRSKLVPGKTIAEVQAFVASRSDLALIATVEVRALGDSKLSSAR